MTISIVGNLTPQDDFPHRVEAVSNFSESALFHFAGHDQAGSLLGGLIRVANRPNEGFAECTILVWLPDGSALFNFERPKIVGNDGWNAAGWAIEVLKAGGIAFRSRYDGTAFLLEDPRLLADPKIAFKEPSVELHFDMQHDGKAPLTEIEHHKPLDSEGEKERFGTGGMQQLTRCSGTIEIDQTRTHKVQGFGWRDHNWGPRNWQGFTDHIFLTGNFGVEQGFSLYSTLDGHGYYFHRGIDTIVKVTSVAFETENFENESVPTALRADVRLANGEHHVIEGRRKAYIPLRNRREGMVTTLGYSLWEYKLDGKQDGIGLGEFLTQSWADGDVKYYHKRRAMAAEAPQG